VRYLVPRWVRCSHAATTWSLLKNSNDGPSSAHGIGPAADAPAGGAAAALPCLSVTTASKENEKEETPPLPGPRRKQAHALTENIKWMAETFGEDRIGFLTLTVGDWEAGGRYRNLRDRKEAQRRFHSLLSNVIARRYQCGVTITERYGGEGRNRSP
jgi:hypothetical protein